MLEKLGLFYGVFCKGQAVKDAIGLKNKQQIINTVAGLLGAAIAVGKYYGYDFHLTPDDLVNISGVVALLLGMFNIGATTASSDKVGLPFLPSRAPIVDHSFTDEQPTMPAVEETTDSAVLTESGVKTNLVTSSDPLAGLDTTYTGH